MKALLSVLLSVLLTGLLLPASLWATTFYVDAATGSDGNNCTAAQNPATPKQTIVGGMGCVTGGTTLLIKGPGPYTSEQITNPPSGTAAAYTIIMADPSGPRPVINVNGALPTGRRGIYITATATYTPQYIRVQGLEWNAPYNCFKMDSTPAETFYPNHIELIDNKCHDTYDTGVLSSYGFSNSQGPQFYVYRNNEFYYIGKSYPTPPYPPGFNVIYGMGHNALVEGNIIHDSSSGIAIWGQSFVTTGLDSVQNNNTIRGNRVYRMGRTDLNPWLAGSGGYDCISQTINGTGNLIYDNVCYDSGNDTHFIGIRVGFHLDAVSDTKVYNNTVYNVLNGKGICVEPWNNRTAPLVEVRNNLTYLANININAAPDCNTNRTTGATGSNNVTANPNFVNAAAGDFHINAGPAVGVGLNLSSVFTTDFDKLTRTVPWDVGAFKFGGTPDTTPPAVPQGFTLQ